LLVAPIQEGGRAGRACKDTLVFCMWPMLWRGHARLTIVRLLNDQFCSGRTVGQSSIISIAQSSSIPPPLSALYCTIYTSSESRSAGRAHTCSDIGYTPLRSTEGYALGQQLRLGLSVGVPSKIGCRLQGSIEQNSYSAYKSLQLCTCMHATIDIGSLHKAPHMSI